MAADIIETIALAARARVHYLAYGTETPSVEQQEAAERHAVAFFANGECSLDMNRRVQAARTRLRNLIKEEA